MVCWILLLISLTPFTWGTFVVNVTQSSYQAEENHNITLDWTFTTTAHMSLSAVYIFCELLTEDKNPVLFHLHEGVEVPESQDKQFSGRVQFDKDVLREGRVRLHVSRLRTEDSGLYLCDVKTEDGAGSDSCHLNVTAAADEPEPQRPTVGRRPASQGETGLYIGLGLTVAAGLLPLCFVLCFVVYLLFKNIYQELKTPVQWQNWNYSRKQQNQSNISCNREMQITQGL